MRILGRLVNPQWGTVNRAARLRLAFFFRRRRTVARLAHAQRASEASGSHIETLATAHLLRL